MNWITSERHSVTEYAPNGAMDRVERRFSQLTSEVSNNASMQEDTAGANPTSAEAKNKGHIVIPYTQGLCKSPGTMMY